MNPEDETAATPVQRPPAAIPVQRPSAALPASQDARLPVPVVTGQVSLHRQDPTAAQAQAPLSPQREAPVHRFGDLSAYLVERLLAFGIDTFAIAFAVATFGFNMLGVGAIQNVQRVASAGSFATLALVSLGSAFALAFVCEGTFGSTLGKLLFSLSVKRSRGGRAGFGRALARRLLIPIDLLLIGPLLALVTPRHQRLGDLFAGTVVARGPLGPLAPVLSLAALAGIGYAQIAFGGGFTSAVGVGAEAAEYLPTLAGFLANPARPIAPQLPPQPTEAPSAGPSP